jgi:hypothetical protein
MIRDSDVLTFRRPMTLLAWAPKIELKEGLSRTIRYFEDLLSDDIVKASIARDLSAEA